MNGKVETHFLVFLSTFLLVTCVRGLMLSSFFFLIRKSARCCWQLEVKDRE